MQTIQDGVYGTDTNGNIVFANPAAARMLGYRIDELVGKPSHELLHHTRQDGSAYPREDCPESASQRDGTVHHVRGGEVFWKKDGKPLAVEFTTSPLRKEGSTEGVLVTFRSTQERERVEQALRESEERFRRLSDATLEGIVITQDGGRILDVNAALAEMFGYAPEDLVGKTTSDLAPLDARENLARRLRANDEAPFESVGLRKDGTKFAVEIAQKAIPYKGRTARVLTIRDLSDRKKAESQSDRILSIYENLPDAFFALDRDFNIVYLNPVAIAMTPPERRGKHLGKNVWEQFPSLKGSKFDIEYHRAMKERVPVHVEEYFDVLDRWFEANAYPSEEGLSVFFRDVTARRRADEVMRAASVSRPLVRRIVQDLVDAGGVAHQILQQVGRKLASDETADSVDGYIRSYAAMGLGDVKLDRSEEGRYTFLGTDLLEKRPGARAATCYFTLGFLTEAVSRVSHGEPTLGTEIDCQSRGSTHCRFVVQVRKPEEGLARRVKELV